MCRRRVLWYNIHEILHMMSIRCGVFFSVLIGNLYTELKGVENLSLIKLQLITQVSASDSDENESMVQGLCAFLLGITVLYNDEQNETFNKCVPLIVS